MLDIVYLVCDTTDVTVYDLIEHDFSLALVTDIWTFCLLGCRGQKMYALGAKRIKSSFMGYQGPINCNGLWFLLVVSNILHFIYRQRNLYFLYYMRLLHKSSGFVHHFISNGLFASWLTQHKKNDGNTKINVKLWCTCIINNGPV